MDGTEARARAGIGAAAFPRTRIDSMLDLVRSTMGRMDLEIAGLRSSLLAEVAELGDTVATARSEITKLRADRGCGDTAIPDAADELDAIADHTCVATETILDACERLDLVATALDPGVRTSIEAETTRIFEACSFQDITGQRIARVVTALKLVEARIEHIAGTYGAAPRARPIPIGAAAAGRPQIPPLAMGQDEIDRLLTF